MSDPKRYDPQLDETGEFDIVMVKSSDGGFVKWEDYALLKSEVERLTIQGGDSEPRFVLLSEYRHLKGLLAFATTKYCILEAEVERLTKAGDDMADHIQSGWVSAERAIDQWNAAKEGTTK